jgi:hypothetical protein
MFNLIQSKLNQIVNETSQLNSDGGFVQHLVPTAALFEAAKSR